MKTIWNGAPSRIFVFLMPEGQRGEHVVSVKRPINPVRAQHNKAAWQCKMIFHHHQHQRTGRQHALALSLTRRGEMAFAAEINGCAQMNIRSYFTALLSQPHGCIREPHTHTHTHTQPWRLDNEGPAVGAQPQHSKSTASPRLHSQKFRFLINCTGLV